MQKGLFIWFRLMVLSMLLRFMSLCQSLGNLFQGLKLPMRILSDLKSTLVILMQLMKKLMRLQYLILLY